MKNVTFKRITVQNFLSVGSDPVSIDFKPGVNIITGENLDKLGRRNGVGKSTMSCALHFAVFGTTVRELKKEMIPHNLNDDTASVVLEFRVESPKGHNDFKIVRSLRPSRVVIYKDGVEKTLDSISNTNKYIQEVLSATPAIFQNCVIMTLGDTKPFMGLKTSEKRKFIEDVLNLRIFSDMLQTARSEYNAQSKDFEIEISKYKEIDNSVAKFEQSRLEIIENQRDQENIIRERIKGILVDIKRQKDILSKTIDADVKTDEENISKLTSKVEKIESAIQDIKKSKWELNRNKEDQQDYIDTLDNKDAVCRTCNRPFDDYDAEHIVSEKEKANNIIIDLDKEILTLSDKISKLDDVRSDINETIQDINQRIVNVSVFEEKRSNATNMIKTLEDSIDLLKQDLKNNKASTVSIDNNINDYNDRLKTCESTLKDIRKRISLLENVKFILSEEGVKTFIIKKMLKVFNNTIQYYLKGLDANCTCVFNEFFEEEIITDKNKLCSYHNFSGAERKSIDLACLFAFKDIRRLNSDVVYNVNFYDELFDTSFDGKGVELVIDVLEERVKKYGECIYVISHKKESIQKATGEIIALEKSNGVTRRVKYTDK